KAAGVFAAGQAAGAVSAPAAALAEGVLKTMLLAKIKTAAALLTVVAVVGIGLGFAPGLTSSAAQTKGTTSKAEEKEGRSDGKKGDAGTADEKLRKAFGDKSDVLKLPIKLDVPKKGMVFAAESMTVDERTGSVQLKRCRVAIFGTGEPPGVYTFSCDEALLT